MDALIQLDRVSKDYVEGGRSRTVLREASATLEDGELIAIRGRSGSGKTTLLNLLAAIDRPSAGDIRVDGTWLGRLSARARTLFRRDHVGIVFQFFNLIPTLSALENVLLPLELASSPKPSSSRAMEMLEQVGLGDRAGAFPDALSGGEQQRVAIARALVKDPRLVLADEPTGNLDDDASRIVMDLLAGVGRGAGRTLVLATHSDAVAARADRVFSIEDGHLVPAKHP
jgi:putative ABC transport system ATP-binding protein